MGAIYGVHVNNGVGPLLPDLTLLQPNVVTLLDPKREDVVALRAGLSQDHHCCAYLCA